MSDVHVYVFVTGSRDADRRHYERIRRELDTHSASMSVLVHGDCRGVDRLAAQIAKDLGWSGVMPIAARWDDGLTAGPNRNQLLVELATLLRWASYEVVWHAFPDNYSRGTWNCVNKARSAGWVEGKDLAIHPL